MPRRPAADAPVWGREARTLLAFERRAAAHFERTIFVSAEEAAAFRARAPECARAGDHVDNGVELGRFNPDLRASILAGARPAIVFTGTMDYRPNIEASPGSPREVMPARAAGASLEVPHRGRQPGGCGAGAGKLARVLVTGPVPDVRPYVAHAAVSVAPLRIARGIQNKVLEAMAMPRPVVASPEAFEGVRQVAGRDLLVADGASETVRCVRRCWMASIPGSGQAARAAVRANHDWNGTLRRLDEVMRPLMVQA
jgi:glycosyltransferase involved in cell wall biosynthesis